MSLSYNVHDEQATGGNTNMYNEKVEHQYELTAQATAGAFFHGYFLDNFGLLGETVYTQPDGNGGFGPQAASPETERLIDSEVKEIVADAYKVCKECLTTNRALLDDLTEMLIDKETVDFQELQDLVGKYHPDSAQNQANNMKAERPETAVMG